MVESNPDGPLLTHLAACVTFFFNRVRLGYLAQVLSNYVGMASTADVYIVTNVSDEPSREEIRAALPSLPSAISLHFVTPKGLGHPYLLTWTHREVLQQIVQAGQATHFLYSEDDLDITRENVAYWLRARELLRPHGLIPSFFRVEQDTDTGAWYSTDCNHTIKFYRQPKLQVSGETYVCAPNPYQGTYFMDRELMEEFVESPAKSPDFGNWGIREKASQGLTLANVPRGYTSRNLVRVDPKSGSIPQECWVHHLPNNYVEDPQARFGKVPMEGLVVTSRIAALRGQLRRWLGDA